MRIWEASTGRCSSSLTHHREAVTCAAWLPCGTRLVTGSHDRTLVSAPGAAALRAGGMMLAHWHALLSHARCWLEWLV